MLNRLFIMAAIFLGGLSFHVNDSSGQSSLPPGAHVAGELLLAGKQGITDTALENIYRGMGAKKIQTFSQIGVHHISVPPQALEHVEAALAKNPNIAYVNKNLIGSLELTPNDPGFPYQSHLASISAPGGWDYTTGSPTVTIAVIDSGIESSHPDLTANIIAGHNFLNNSTNTSDTSGHGTAVAGVAAAVGNSGVGVSGVSWRSTIMPLVVVDSNGQVTLANVCSAIIYAADHGAKVINLSMAFIGTVDTLQSAVNYAWNKGLIIAASAGNYSTSTPYYPAAFSNVLGVSALTPNGSPSSFSNYGNWIKLAAQGEDVYTTWVGATYGWGAGTSMSSPIVAGVAALVFSLNPSLTNAQVFQLMTANADDLGANGFDQSYGWGRVNAQRTLQAAANTSNSALTVDIVSPSDGTSLQAGTVNVQVNANASAGVTKVDLYVDGILQGSSSTSPYTIPWYTGTNSAQHGLVAKVTDNTGKTANSPSETVTVTATTITADTTPPSVSLTSVGIDNRFLTATVSASDSQSGVAKVDLYVDGVLKATDTSSPWAFKINTRSWSKGTHTVQARAQDGSGNSSMSTPISVTK